MISASGNKRRLESFCDSHHIETDNAMIKIHGFIHIAHMQMHMPDAHLRRDGSIQPIVLLDVLEQRLHIEGFAAVTPGTVGAARFELPVRHRPGAVFG